MATSNRGPLLPKPSFARRAFIGDAVARFLLENDLQRPERPCFLGLCTLRRWYPAGSSPPPSSPCPTFFCKRQVVWTPQPLLPKPVLTRQYPFVQFFKDPQAGFPEPLLGAPLLAVTFKDSPKKVGGPPYRLALGGYLPERHDLAKPPQLSFPLRGVKPCLVSCQHILLTKPANLKPPFFEEDVTFQHSSCLFSFLPLDPPQSFLQFMQSLESFNAAFSLIRTGHVCPDTFSET